MLLLTINIVEPLVYFVFYNWTNIFKGCLIDYNDILNRKNPIIQEIRGPMLSHY